MSSYYKQLVEELGEEGARERMREIRAKVTKPTGFAIMSVDKRKEISKKGNEARWHDKTQNARTENQARTNP